MKKKYLILIFSIVLLNSCNNDDNNTTQEQFELSGTHWVNTADNDRFYTFINTFEYVYSEEGSSYSGTYFFNGNSGTMTGTNTNFEAGFVVNADILSVNQNQSNPDFEALYLKQ